MGRFFTIIIFCGVSVSLFGCVSSRKTPEGPRWSTDPHFLLEKACSPGKGIQSVQGTVWLRAKSKEASGKFPAVVKVSDQNLEMEVTNLFGGTEARIEVDHNQYKITVPGKSSQNREGNDSWGGIPLKWAHTLFLGQIPCPGDSELKNAKFSVASENELIVLVSKGLNVDEQTFSYRFKEYDNAPWPEFLVWERKGIGAIKVDFEFSDPEDKTQSPLRWKATSSQGEVKTRWKRRNAS